MKRTSCETLVFTSCIPAAPRKHRCLEQGL